MRVRRLFGWAGIAIVAASGALVILVHNSAFQQWSLRRLENIAKAGGIEFSAQHIYFDPYKLQATLDGVVYVENGTSMRASRVSIDLPWNVFTSAVKEITSLEVDNLEIKLNSSETLVPSPSGKPTPLPKFRFDRLVVRNGSLDYRNQSMQFQIPAFSVDINQGRGSLRFDRTILLPPALSLDIHEIQLSLSDDGIQFGPSGWKVMYAEYNGAGTAEGQLKWAPTLATDVSFSTEPLTVRQWKQIRASGKINFDKGILRITDFRAEQGKGEVLASAEISDKKKSLIAAWKRLELGPAGIPANSNGTVSLQWKASDFSDTSGSGSVALVSQYGRAQSEIEIQNAKALLRISATAPDTNATATVRTGLDKKIEGNFQASYRKYGDIRAQGNIRGALSAPVVRASVQARGITYQGIGPLNGYADTSLQNNIVLAENIHADLKQSTLESASLRLDLQSKSMQAQIPQIMLHVEDVLSQASGIATMSADLSGTLDSPAAAFQGASAGLDYGGTHIDSAEVAGRLEDKTLTFDKITATQTDGRLHAQGTLDIQTRAVAADFMVDNFAVRNVHGISTTAFLSGKVGGDLKTPSTDFTGELRDVFYKGESQGNVTLSGTTAGSMATIQAKSDKYSANLVSDLQLCSPYAFTATLTADKSHIQHAQYEGVVSGKAEATGQAQPFKLNRIALQNVTATGNGVNLTANGNLDDGLHADLTAALSQLPVEGLTFTGTADAHATLTGTIEHPFVDGTIDTNNATVRAPQMTEPVAFTTNVSFHQNQFDIRSMRAEIAGGHVDIEGHGVLKGPATLAFHAADIHPEALLADRPVSGTITADGTASLTEPSLKGASGEVSVSQLDLLVHDTEIHQAEPVRVSLKDEMLTIDSFHIEGADTTAVIRGGAALQSGTLNLDVNADTNLRIFEAFLPDASVTGRMQTEASIRGPRNQPRVNGFVQVANTDLQIETPPMDLRALNVQLDLLGDRLEIRRADANLNGGTFTATGKSGFSVNGLHDSSLTLHAEKVQLEYPEGLQSEINSELTLTGDGVSTTLEGEVEIVSALYRDNIDLSQQIFSGITKTSEILSVARPSLPKYAHNIELDVTVQTPGLVTISNNVADLDLSGDFRIRGSLSDPIIIGRAEVNEGGELYFGPGIAVDEAAPLERRDRYAINRGVIEFNNAVRTEPDFDFETIHELQAKDERYLITLRASGTPSTLRTEFSSDPFLSESDIISMLLTGRTFEELQGSHLAVAREQLAGYLTGQFSGFFNTAGTALGLDTVRLDAVSLAADQDISAKLVVGKNITKDFNFTFSQNLNGARSQAWIAAYNPYRNFLLRAVNETDQREVRLELKQTLNFGGGPPLPKRIAPRAELVLGKVTFTGASESPDALMRKITKPGKPFSAYRMNDDVRKLEKFYSKSNFLDVKVRGHRNSADGKIDVDYEISKGPEILLEYEGAEVPNRVKDDIRKIWIDSLTQAPALRGAEARLVQHFRDHGYLKANVTHREESPGSDSHRFVFVIEQGAKYEDPDWQILGPEKDMIDSIRSDIKESTGEVLAAPEDFRKRVEYNLQKKGFLVAEATAPELVIDGMKSHLTMHVSPGAQYMVGKLEFSGNTFFNAEHLQRVVILGATQVIPKDQAGRPPDAEKPLEPFPFTSTWIETARQRITAEYWQQGYNDVKIKPSSDWDKTSSRISISFEIEEGERQVVNRVSIDGPMLTDMSYIHRQFQFHEGDPVDYSRINLTRKKLYDTGLFKRVDIEVQPDTNGYKTSIHLNENAPWRFRYGFAVANRLQTSDRQLGVNAELKYGNLFGRGISLGTSVTAQQQERDVRTFASFPEFMHKRVITTGTLFRTRDRTIPETTQYFLGLTGQQQWRLTDYYVLTYDFTYQQVRALGPGVDPRDPAVNDFRYNVGKINIAISRDTRDDILNATRGTFLSNSFEVAPPGLGTTFTYVKNFAQYFRYRQVRKNLVWASGYRAGLARGFGSVDLVPAEQFLAGGGTSLRGFRQDQLTLEPGNGLLIMNQELRFPLFWRFGGVAFFDVGNIYHDVKSVRPWDLRYSPGVGLRVATPFMLFRFDFGMNLSTRSGEPPRRFVFGIGQAF
jgi:outer membrane protein assembly factor BamA/autotransporter translocation and assembly factor TamB